MATTFPSAVDVFVNIPAGSHQVEVIGGRTHYQFHNDVGDAVELLEAIAGTTPGPNDVMSYVRLHDGTSKGLWVPLSSLVSEPLTINGNFDHWQRMAAGVRTTTTTWNKDTSFAADRIYVLPQGASVTQQRSTTTVDRSQYSLQVNGAASVTTVAVGTRIPARIVNTRGLQSLVFSCWVYNNTGAAFTPTLFIGTPGALDTFTTVTNRLTQALQSCVDSNWTRVHHVFDPTAYTNIANGMQVDLQVPTGVLVATKVARFAQFDLRPGTQYRSYVPPDPDDELNRCRGTYYKTYDRDVVPGTATNLGTIMLYVDTLSSSANRSWTAPARFTVQMWGIPTITTYNPVTLNDSGKVQMAGGAMAAVVNSVGQNGCWVTAQDTSTTAVAQSYFHVVANAELT